MEYIARKAGEIILQNFGLGMEKEWKGDGSPVTKTDKEVNRILIEEVEKHFPHHDICGEEESRMFHDSEYLWVCDPVDGTIPFSHGLPISTFSLALVYKGKPIVGVIYDPFHDKLLFGERGKGTTLNDKRVHVNDYGNLDNKTYIVCERFGRAKYEIQDMVNQLHKKGVRLTQMCSVLFPSMYICMGEVHGTIFPHTTVHDGAALKILIEEAGGRMTDIYGNEQNYDKKMNGYIASNGVIHDELVRLAKKYVVESNSII